MTGFDYAVIAVIVLSVALGLWRGLVYEVLSLLVWVAAVVVARWCGPILAPYLGLQVEAIRIAVAATSLFIATLIVGGLLASLLSKSIKWAGLRWLDGLLGALFGLLRGVLLVLITVMLAGLTTLPQQTFWREAGLSKPLVQVVLATRAWLPESVAQRVHY